MGLGFQLPVALQDFISSVLGGNIINGILAVIVAIGGGIVFWLKGKDNINEGEAGFVLRNGKVRRNRKGDPRLRRPGLILLVPWLDKLWRTSIQHRTRALTPQQRETWLNGKIIAYEELRAVIYFRVIEPFLVLEKAEDLDEQVLGICNSYLDDLVRKGRSNARIRSVFKNLVKSDLAQYGVEYIDLRFQFGGHTIATQFANTFAAAGVQVTVPFLPVIENTISGNGHRTKAELDALEMES